MEKFKCNLCGYIISETDIIDHMFEDHKYIICTKFASMVICD